MTMIALGVRFDPEVHSFAIKGPLSWADGQRILWHARDSLVTRESFSEIEAMKEQEKMWYWAKRYGWKTLDSLLEVKI